LAPSHLPMRAGWSPKATQSPWDTVAIFNEFCLPGQNAR